MPDSNAALTRGPGGTTRGEPDEGAVLKADDILPMTMLSLTALPHKGQETKSCDVGGAEWEEPLIVRSEPLERSTAD